MLIGDVIKKKRIEANITQDSLAKKTGVRQQSICDIERGKIKKPRFIVELAKALNCSIDSLYAEIGEKHDNK